MIFSFMLYLSYPQPSARYCFLLIFYLLAISSSFLCSDFQLISHLVISFIRMSPHLAYEQEFQQHHPKALI